MWRDIGFRSSVGWRAAFIYEEDGSHDILVVAGWLIQEWVVESENGALLFGNEPPTNRQRRVAAGIVSGDDGASLEAVDANEDVMEWPAFWRLLAPDEAAPSDEQWAAQLAHKRVQLEDMRRGRRAAAAEIAPKVLMYLAEIGPATAARIADGLQISRRRAMDACGVLTEQGQAAFDKATLRYELTAPKWVHG